MLRELGLLVRMLGVVLSCWSEKLAEKREDAKFLCGL